MPNPKVINSYSPDDWLLSELARRQPKWSLGEWPVDRDLAGWEVGLAADLREILGLDHVEPVEREVKLLDRYEDDGFTIERILYDSETGVIVPGLILLPHTRDLPVPAVIVCQDRGLSKFAAALPRWTFEGDPTRSIVRRLLDDHFIVCLMDPVCAGERAADERAHVAAEAWMGRPLSGRWVHDALAAIDVLVPRQEVQSDRLAVMGMGAGGAVALHAMALDKRLRVGVVGGQLASYADRIRHMIASRWASLDEEACTMVPGALRLAELSDVAALCAPQPLLMLHGPEDRNCPIDSARECAQEIRDGYGRRGGKGLFRAEFLPEIGSRAAETVREFLALHLRAQFV